MGRMNKPEKLIMDYLSSHFVSTSGLRSIDAFYGKLLNVLASNIRNFKGNTPNKVRSAIQSLSITTVDVDEMQREIKPKLDSNDDFNASLTNVLTGAKILRTSLVETTYIIYIDEFLARLELRYEGFI